MLFINPILYQKIIPFLNNERSLINLKQLTTLSSNRHTVDSCLIVTIVHAEATKD